MTGFHLKITVLRNIGTGSQRLLCRGGGGVAALQVGRAQRMEREAVLVPQSEFHLGEGP